MPRTRSPPGIGLNEAATSPRVYQSRQHHTRPIRFAEISPAPEMVEAAAKSALADARTCQPSCGVPASQLAYLRCWRTLARAAPEGSRIRRSTAIFRRHVRLSAPARAPDAGDVVFRLHQEPLPTSRRISARAMDLRRTGAARASGRRGSPSRPTPRMVDAPTIGSSPSARENGQAWQPD